MKQTRCPIHPTADSHPIVRDAQDQFWGFEGRFDYECCDECGTWYISPRPTESVLSTHYEGYYSTEELLFLRKRFLRRRPNYGVDGLRAWDTIRSLGKLGYHLDADDTVLDVGCGAGGFLAKLRADTGAQVRGLDTNPRCVRFVEAVHNIDADCGSLAEQTYAPGHFNMITAWHCVEHTIDPHAEVAFMHTVLAPGGWMVLEVPTAGLLARIFRHRWVFLQAPTHLYHFSEEAMRSLVERHGFTVREVKRPWLPTEFAGSILFALGMNRFAPRMLFENRPLSNYLWRALMYVLMPVDLVVTAVVTAVGRGSALRVIAQKEESS
ncbi:MAG: class I SAM-dependent methyltransferase [Myxococcota bacterium]|nr:class I SAM-dependent methyltransferase [Myxococcota bacterium]